MTKLICTLFLLFLPCFFADIAFANDGGSGLPVPRFATLKSDEVNVRTGPGTRYPIAWVYHRSGLPVEITEEFGYWRKIRDIEGAGGWVYKSMLDGRRSVMIKGKSSQMVLEDPDSESARIAKVEPTVIGKLLECKKDWCRVKIEDRKGWIKKSHLWGIYADETVP